MKLPRAVLQPVSVRFVHFLTIGLAVLFIASIPMSASAADQQLACSPTSLRFGSVDRGHAEVLLVTVTNTGATSVTLSSVSISNSAFSTSSLSLPYKLSAGESVDVNVTFTPGTTGWAGGTIAFISNGSNPTLVLQVSGGGVTSTALTASPSLLSFGSIATGSQSTLPVVITNDRSWNLTLSSATTSVTQFTMSGATFPLTLEAGQSVTLNVTFAPQSAGEIGGSLFVYGAGLNIPLTGTGTAADQYSVSLTWNYSAGADGYNVYRSTSANGKFSKINSTLDANTAYTDSTAASGQTYYYEATAVNSSGQESALSTPAVQVTIP